VGFGRRPEEASSNRQSYWHGISFVHVIILVLILILILITITIYGLFPNFAH
jgi:uncharacterized membrane protein YhaH (DUF805 family)